MGSPVFAGSQRMPVAYDGSPHAEHAINVALPIAGNKRTPYADAYRAQLNQGRELSAVGTTSPELERDLSLLMKWNAETAETRVE